MATKSKALPTDGQLIAGALVNALHTNEQQENVTDGLFAIARALERIADTYELDTSADNPSPRVLALERIAMAIETFTEKAIADDVIATSPAAVDSVVEAIEAGAPVDITNP